MGWAVGPHSIEDSFDLSFHPFTTGTTGTGSTSEDCVGSVRGVGVAVGTWPQPSRQQRGVAMRGAIALCAGSGIDRPPSSIGRCLAYWNRAGGGWRRPVACGASVWGGVVETRHAHMGNNGDCSRRFDSIEGGQRQPIGGVDRLAHIIGSIVGALQTWGLRLWPQPVRPHRPILARLPSAASSLDRLPACPSLIDLWTDPFSHHPPHLRIAWHGQGAQGHGDPHRRAPCAGCAPSGRVPQGTSCRVCGCMFIYLYTHRRGSQPS